MRYDKKSIAEKVSELGCIQPWNHNFILPEGVETRPGNQVSHGKNLVKLKRLKPLFDLLDLKGKKVLDMGCNEGFFSLEMASSGADVNGIDIDEKRILKANFIKKVLAPDLPVSFCVQDVYSPEFSSQNRFDLCLCLGFIHRIPDPFRALASLADRSDVIIFEWKALKHGPHDDAFAYLSPKDVNREDFYGTEYWILSFSAVERILARQGFKYFHRIDDPRQKRAILVAGRVNHRIFDSPDLILHRGRLRALLSHGKRFLKTCCGIISGRVNS